MGILLDCISMLACHGECCGVQLVDGEDGIVELQPALVDCAPLELEVGQEGPLHRYHPHYQPHQLC